MVSTSLMKPVGSFGTSVSILLAASSSRCFLLFLPTQKNFDGSEIGGRNFNPRSGEPAWRVPPLQPIFQSRERRGAAGDGGLDRGRRNRPMQRVGGRNHVDHVLAADDAEPRLRPRFGKGCQRIFTFLPAIARRCLSRACSIWQHRH